MMRKKENKNYRSVPLRSYPMRNGKFPKKIQTKLKILIKKNILASFQAKIGWKMLRNRENKNYRFVSFLPDA